MTGTSASRNRPHYAMPLLLAIAAAFVALLPSPASAAPPPAPTVTVPSATVTDPRELQFTIGDTETDVVFRCKFEYMTDYFFCGNNFGGSNSYVLYQNQDPTPPGGTAPIPYHFFARPGTHTLTVTADNFDEVSAPTTSASFTVDWNERARISYDALAVGGGATISVFDSSGRETIAGNIVPGTVPDLLVSGQTGVEFGDVEVFPLDVSIVDRQEPSTRTLYFCASGSVPINYRLANDDAAETPQTGSVDLSAAGGAVYLARAAHRACQSRPSSSSPGVSASSIRRVAAPTHCRALHRRRHPLQRRNARRARSS